MSTQVESVEQFDFIVVGGKSVCSSIPMKGGVTRSPYQTLPILILILIYLLQAAPPAAP